MRGCMCVCVWGGGGGGGEGFDRRPIQGGEGFDRRPIQDQGMNLTPHVGVYSVRLSLYHVP